jgi:hypothetical protein
MPVAIVTVQCVRAARVAPPAVRVSVAVAVPEFVAAAVNVVEAHPLILGESEPDMINAGSTTVIVSETASARFNANIKDTDDAAAVIG